MLGGLLRGLIHRLLGGLIHGLLGRLLDGLRGLDGRLLGTNRLLLRRRRRCGLAERSLLLVERHRARVLLRAGQRDLEGEGRAGPALLATESLPDISSTRRLEMARPRPVPP